MKSNEKIVQEFSECVEILVWKCKNCFNLNKIFDKIEYQDKHWFNGDEYEKVQISELFCEFCKGEQKVGKRF